MFNNECDGCLTKKFLFSVNLTKSKSSHQNQQNMIVDNINIVNLN